MTVIWWSRTMTVIWWSWTMTVIWWSMNQGQTTRRDYSNDRVRFTRDLLVHISTEERDLELLESLHWPGPLRHFQHVESNCLAKRSALSNDGYISQVHVPTTQIWFLDLLMVSRCSAKWTQNRWQHFLVIFSPVSCVNPPQWGTTNVLSILRNMPTKLIWNWEQCVRTSVCYQCHINSSVDHRDVKSSYTSVNHFLTVPRFHPWEQH